MCNKEAFRASLNYTTPSTRMDPVEGSALNKWTGIRWARATIHHLWEFLKYLISFTTSSWIIDYLTAWY